MSKPGKNMAFFWERFWARSSTEIFIKVYGMCTKVRILGVVFCQIEMVFKISTAFVHVTKSV